LLLPPFAPLLLIFVGLLILRWRPRLGQTLAWVGLLISLLLIFPFSVEKLLAPLEEDAPLFNRQAAKSAGAIVILGGGRYGNAREYGKPTVNRLTLERVRYGARLAKLTGLPVMVSGGVGGPYSEANVMAEALKTDFGVTALWREDRSATTAENAQYAAVMLKEAGIKHIILVTHAAHMRRAVAYFEAEGLQVTPAPMAFFGPLMDSENSLSYLPSANSAYAGWYAAHEWAGLLQQRFSK